MKLSYTVYILHTSGDTFYTGIARDLHKRLECHKNGTGAKYMRRFKSFALVYRERKNDRSTATKRELKIKSLSRTEKEKLIAKTSKLDA